MLHSLSLSLSLSDTSPHCTLPCSPSLTQAVCWPDSLSTATSPRTTPMPPQPPLNLSPSAHPTNEPPRSHSLPSLAFAVGARISTTVSSAATATGATKCWSARCSLVHLVWVSLSLTRSLSISASELPPIRSLALTLSSLKCRMRVRNQARPSCPCMTNHFGTKSLQELTIKHIWGTCTRCPVAGSNHDQPTIALKPRGVRIEPEEEGRHGAPSSFQSRLLLHRHPAKRISSISFLFSLPL